MAWSRRKSGWPWRGRGSQSGKEGENGSNTGADEPQQNQGSSGNVESADNPVFQLQTSHDSERQTRPIIRYMDGPCLRLPQPSSPPTPPVVNALLSKEFTNLITIIILSSKVSQHVGNMFCKKLPSLPSHARQAFDQPAETSPLLDISSWSDGLSIPGSQDIMSPKRTEQDVMRN